ncbi:MAG: hypothetical protein OEW66_10490 [Actinomycetota bacterium]|nr:hypothetical protein [Actinomycetota bacterium]MDH5314244.1 hypothetical protein [Actinomycetota bacterium]
MRVTFRDGVTTILAGVVVAIALAVTEGWGWPMLGSTRAGIIALGLVGIAMCSIGTRAEDMATGRKLLEHPGMIVGSVLGAVALGVLIVGIFVDTEAMLVALAVVLLLLWFVATTRHAATRWTAGSTHGGLAHEG